ncbi:MAG TPA: hypothetical protein VMP01_25985 [Pirellulaceae bacterium]|nr:hypothetical protein [Pirellulaceae bacterium]
MSWYGGWRPYVPVAKRRAKAASYAARLAKKEKRALAPVSIEGRKIAASFWGQAWCEHLEHHCDFENRLPRGRTYVRNGSVIDLTVERGLVKAIVSGSEIYQVTVKIKTLAPAAWKRIKQECSQSIASLIDLLQGRFDEGIMRRLCDPKAGLFPRPAEIEMKCTCPDWASMCKHVAATLYGVGARLDVAPEMLFTLRNVDHLELINQAVAAENLDRSLAASGNGALGDADLGEMFGIEIDAAQAPDKRRRSRNDRVAAAVPPVEPALAAAPAKRRRKDPAITLPAPLATKAAKTAARPQRARRSAAAVKIPLPSKPTVRRRAVAAPR